MSSPGDQGTVSVEKRAAFQILIVIAVPGDSNINEKPERPPSLGHKAIISMTLRH